jgi:glycosyltransferase involved in cell wall biosynthesis
MVKDKTKKQLSVIMPALNEAVNIGNAIKSSLLALDHYGINGDIIVINDGSLDNTLEIINNIMLTENRVFCINHESPKGIGISFWEGVNFSNAENVILIPGDDENDPVDALRYFHLIGDVDIIVPFIMNIMVRNYTRRLLSSIYKFIINNSFGLSLNYTNGTVIYNRSILKSVNLETTGFFYQSELLIKLIRAGYFYSECPHILSKRSSGDSKALKFNSWVVVISSYLKLFINIHILRKHGRTDLEIDKNSATFKRLNNEYF